MADLTHPYLYRYLLNGSLNNYLKLPRKPDNLLTRLLSLAFKLFFFRGSVAVSVALALCPLDQYNEPKLDCQHLF